MRVYFRILAGDWKVGWWWWWRWKRWWWWLAESPGTGREHHPREAPGRSGESSPLGRCDWSFQDCTISYHLWSISFPYKMIRLCKNHRETTTMSSLEGDDNCCLGHCTERVESCVYIKLSADATTSFQPIHKRDFQTLQLPLLVFPTKATASFQPLRRILKQMFWDQRSFRRNECLSYQIMML